MTIPVNSRTQGQTGSEGDGWVTARASLSSAFFLLIWLCGVLMVWFCLFPKGTPQEEDDGCWLINTFSCLLPTQRRSEYEPLWHAQEVFQNGLSIPTVNFNTKACWIVIYNSYASEYTSGFIQFNNSEHVFSPLLNSITRIRIPLVIKHEKRRMQMYGGKIMQ